MSQSAASATPGHLSGQSDTYNWGGRACLRRLGRRHGRPDLACVAEHSALTHPHRHSEPRAFPARGSFRRWWGVWWGAAMACPEIVRSATTKAKTG